MENWTERMDLAAVFCRARRCEEAIGELELILDRDPGQPDVQCQIGYCYSGACCRHALTSPDIALGHFRLALRHCRQHEDHLLRARILAALGNTYLHSRLMPHPDRFEAAIRCHETAAGILLRHGDTDGWAREQYNMGNAWCEAPGDEHPRKWSEAIRRFELALSVRTLDHDPRRHAATLQNLGTAYRELRSGDRAAHVGVAIRCYRQALRIYTLQALPLKYAALQNNLGTAYLTLGREDTARDEKNIRRAVRHLDRALRVWTREKHPCSHAVALFNRGNALVLMAGYRADPPASLREAASCFHEAGVCFRHCGQTTDAGNADARLALVRSWLAAA